MYTLRDYLRDLNWQPTKTHRNGKEQGCCPFHNERSPSFYYSPDTDTCKCFGAGCGISADLVRAVKTIEFPSIGEDGRDWRPVYQRVEDLGGQVAPRPLLPLPPRDIVVLPGPTALQMAFMEVMRGWSHWFLTHPTYGIEGRQWLVTQGISPRLQDIPDEVGYLPVLLKGQYRDSLECHLGNLYGHHGWQETARSLGFLWHNEDTFRLYQRILFFCADPQRNIQFYTARSILPKPLPGTAQATHFIPHIGPTGLKKYPFTLPLSRPRFPGTVITESAKGPTTLYSNCIRGGAILGTGLDFTTLLELPPPWYIATDADHVHTHRTGETYRPGETLYQNLMTFATAHHIPTMRILIPSQYKDLDTWKCHEGVIPLAEQIYAYHAQREDPTSSPQQALSPQETETEDMQLVS